MTKSAQQFVTPLSVSALTNERVFTNLFDLNDEHEIGHIRLSRESDLIVVAPATANLIARMASGQANDLATTVLLATNKPVLVAPSMNPHMWAHPATQRNVAQIISDGAHVLDPGVGEMAERDEVGKGRLPEVPQLIEAIESLLSPAKSKWHTAANNATNSHGHKPLNDRHVIVTSGPTHEPIDPVRYIANRSSGKQGYALASAAAQAGARVTLITGPVDELNAPIDDAQIKTIKVQTANDMLKAVRAAGPSDIAIFAAAVADWRVKKSSVEKIKKSSRENSMSLTLRENPDILKTIATAKRDRPTLVIGFAAETENLVAHASKKLKSKGADWIVANNVSPSTGIMGGDENEVSIVSSANIEVWPRLPKSEVARRIIARAANHLNQNDKSRQDAAE